MDQWAFFDELKAGTVHNVYLFYGQEAYIRKNALSALEKKTLMPGMESIDRVVLTAPDAQTLMESCETLPMMSEYRLVIVRECALLTSLKAAGEAQDTPLLCDYVARVPKSTCLVFEAEGAIDRRKKLSKVLLALPGAVSFDALSDDQLLRWMQQQLRPLGKQMDDGAGEALAFASGRNLTLLSAELNKLAAYTGERRLITAQDVEQIATKTVESTVFVMVDALSAGQAGRAFELLGVLLAAGEQRIGILAMITRHYRQLMHLSAMLAQREPQAGIAQRLGIPPFAVRRLTGQLGGRTFEQMKAMTALCVQADFDVKQGAVREDAALERLMLVLAGSGRAQ